MLSFQKNSDWILKFSNKLCLWIKGKCMCNKRELCLSSFNDNLFTKLNNCENVLWSTYYGKIRTIHSARFFHRGSYFSSLSDTLGRNTRIQFYLLTLLASITRWGGLSRSKTTSMLFSAVSCKRIPATNSRDDALYSTVIWHTVLCLRPPVSQDSHR